MQSTTKTTLTHHLWDVAVLLQECASTFRIASKG